MGSTPTRPNGRMLCRLVSRRGKQAAPRHQHRASGGGMWSKSPRSDNELQHADRSATHAIVCLVAQLDEPGFMDPEVWVRLPPRHVSVDDPWIARPIRPLRRYAVADWMALRPEVESVDHTLLSRTGKPISSRWWSDPVTSCAEDRHLALSSIGQDGSLSRSRDGFDSRWRCFVSAS